MDRSNRRKNIITYGHVLRQLRKNITKAEGHVLRLGKKEHHRLKDMCSYIRKEHHRQRTCAQALESSITDNEHVLRHNNATS
jgi:hypothetical protein